MSYCRFSSDNFSCDIYCYDGGSHFVTHVAGNRHVGDIPKLLPLPAPGDQEGCNAWVAAHNAQMAFLDTAERAPIGLEHDGKSFSDDTLEDLLVRLISLKAMGYNVPDFAFEAIRDEIAEQIL